MITKKKICCGCDLPQHIWKNAGGGRRFCKGCWAKEFATVSRKKTNPAPRSPIKKVSDKRAKLDEAYKVLRREYLKSHYLCEVVLEGCTKNAVSIHHKYSGRNRNKYYLDFTTVMSTCMSCHEKLHKEYSADELIQMGLKLTE